jgi:hypothetical protein
MANQAENFVEECQEFAKFCVRLIMQHEGDNDLEISVLRNFMISVSR